MCEVLVRVVDKVSADPYRDAELTKRGDVIVVVADGHQWGTEDLANPHWRIVKLPNVPESTARNFLSKEVDTNPSRPSRMLQRRALKLDLAHASLPAGFAAWLADDSRAQPTRTVNLSATQFAGLKIIKPARPDPNIL